ncbi:hypothetical protein ACRB68_46180 [Actinomadura sp. RB68]|uniref:Uncharacterized protein n=1 Tax=Actinomadura macrotermitis TaxID=2585200 RepID=A0A7K0BZC3_9ACTN|nr:hypothetical protein [Actinomadura macrotermitis]
MKIAQEPRIYTRAHRNDQIRRLTQLQLGLMPLLRQHLGINTTAGLMTFDVIRNHVNEMHTPGSREVVTQSMSSRPRDASMPNDHLWLTGIPEIRSTRKPITLRRPRGPGRLYQSHAPPGGVLNFLCGRTKNQTSHPNTVIQG